MVPAFRRTVVTTVNPHEKPGGGTLNDIKCPICSLPIEDDCEHLVADLDMTFSEVHGGILVDFLIDLEEPPDISELYPLLVKSGGKAICWEVQGPPGFTSENCVVFATDPEALVHRCLVLMKEART